jgi:sporadic carbohydrate cluster protein (TIGR04323 family)|tara:strand:- start:125 stop:505 length:381 start_codon:yes stop_codon:yes gene_type:complete
MRLKGYIFSRSFMGERAPQHVQNIVIKDFCKNNSFDFLLSVSEYKMKNSFLILKDLLKKLKSIDGIVAYSLFQLPETLKERNKVLNIILNKKKIICFAVEKLEVRTKKDIKKINTLWKIKQSLESN